MVHDDAGVRQRFADGFGVAGGHVDRDVGDPGAELRCLGLDPIHHSRHFTAVDLRQQALVGGDVDHSGVESVHQT